MDMELPQAAAPCDDPLSSEFSSKNIDESSSASDRYGETPSTAPDLPASSGDHSEAAGDNVCDFQQPTDSESGEKIEEVICIPDSMTRDLERVQILEENVDKSDESQWVEWPDRFIEGNGFRLGIDPGDFYKHESMPYFYVKLPHRSKFEVTVANNNPVPCDLDLYINGLKTNQERLLAGVSHSIDSPFYSNFAFKCFRSQNAPSGTSVKKGHRNNGLVKAVFTPEKERHSRGRTLSEPAYTERSVQSLLDILENPIKEKKTRSYTTNDQDRGVRSLDMKGVVEGVTLLQGEKKTRYFVAAPEMEVDVSKRVTLQLRLIASATEEVAATDKEAYACEPPPIT